MNYLEMPFGKYKGEPLEELPTSYIGWVPENCDINPTLQNDLLEVLSYRYAGTSSVAPPENALIKSIYKRLCIKYHPDKGGSTEAMQAINEFYQLLNDNL